MVTGKCRLTVFIQKPKTRETLSFILNPRARILSYSTDVTFKEAGGAAASFSVVTMIVAIKNMYGVNVDSGNHKVKFWRWVQ